MDHLSKEGILVGGATFQLFNKSFVDQVRQCCGNIECAVLDGGYSFRGLLKGGHMYRVNETLFVDDGCLKISGIYSIKVGSEYRHFVMGTMYSRVPSLGFQQLVLKSNSVIIIPAVKIIRKVMLYLQQHPSAAASSSKQYEVIDYQRPHSAITAADLDVVVPFYPEQGDMIWVQGDRNEVWLGLVHTTDTRNHFVKLYFYVEHEPGSI